MRRVVVPPLADPLRRAAGLRPRRPDLRRRGARRRAVGGAAAGGARGRAPRWPRAARGAARWRSRAPSRSSRSTPRPRHVDGAERADRVPPAHRAPDDRRQRAGRPAARASAASPRSTASTSRPSPRRSRGSSTQLASLDVATPPVPEHLSPPQAAELVAECSRAGRRARAPRDGHGRQALTSLVLRSLKQAHYAPRNLGHAGLGLAALLPLHVADPPLPGPRLPPRAAVAVGAGEERAATAALDEAGDVDVDARARRDDDRARRRRRRALLPARARALRGPGCDARVRRRGHGRDRRRRVRRASATATRACCPVRRLRGDWWELNEEGTILHGARQRRAAIRLGDPRARAGRARDRGAARARRPRSVRRRRRRRRRLRLGPCALAAA